MQEVSYRASLFTIAWRSSDVLQAVVRVLRESESKWKSKRARGCAWVWMSDGFVGDGELGGKHYLADELEPLAGRDVPLPALLDLGEDPRLDECPTADHDPVDVVVLHLVPVVLGRETVASAEDRYGFHCN